MYKGESFLSKCGTINPFHHLSLYPFEAAGGLHCSGGGAKTTPSVVLAHPILTKTFPRVACDVVSLPSTLAEKSTPDPTPLNER